jgi:hypothetical protein
MDPVLPDKPRYERIGKCNQCGWCCRNENCEHLEVTNGKATCRIHPTLTGGVDKRPSKCANFPQLPPILHNGCGYSFVDQWDANRRLGLLEV